ncbi:unnamed protein product [Bursaphelenchus xylophilus]|uniref:(pine wood nematode) hypothetical protein n=1 Tax=Bursaphelenchus xylophilus TaxID=6326 RepID=A0A1I7S2F0_BURXY|nr:unnamed protein product [Bursaphelenchus xylophilus]CAG9114605.1 unnamed protein product [Bursaphelenchus xylophilus]
MTNTDFPRGGELKPLENKRPTGTKRKATDDVEEPSKKRVVDEQYADVFIQKLKKELFTTDVRGLGIVREIKDTEIILEAASGLSVKVPVKQMPKLFVKSFGEVELSDVYQLGQSLAFKIEKAAGKAKNEKALASIDPAVVNSHIVSGALKNALVLNGTIQSLEGKGAVVDLGIGKTNGFVQTADVPDAFKPLKVGQVLLFRVRKTSKKAERVAQLSAFADSDTYAEDGLDQNQLLPGTIILSEPEKVVSTGLFVKLSDNVRAFVHKSNLPPRIRLDPSRLGKSLRVIVTSILPNSPLFTLTAHPDIISTSNPAKKILRDEHKVGSMVEATAYDVDKLGNVYFYLGDAEKPEFVTAKAFPTGFDDYENEVSEFGKGTTHEMKVIGYQWLERSLILSNKKDVKKQTVLEMKNMEPGRRVVGFVKSVKPKGVMVRFGAKGETEVVGFVQAEHVFDKKQKDWMQSVEIGQRMTCRVLFYDSEKERLFLTARPSLVNSNLPIVNEFSKKFIGEVTMGQLLKKMSSGAFLVAFYNKVCGLLPAPEVRMFPEKLDVNHVVKCRIQKVDEANERILLSLGEENAAKREREIKKEEAALKAKEDAKNAKKAERIKQKEAVKEAKREKKEKRVKKQQATLDWDMGEFSMQNLSKVGKNGDDIEVKEEDDKEIKEEDVEEEDYDEGEADARKKRFEEAVAENPADFDRLLTMSPNSSELWIKYMTLFASQGKLKEARDIVKRALEAINYREQQELFNVWTASLNLELIFGTPETFKQVFEKATVSMDALKVHRKVIDIYKHHKKTTEALELYDQMMKKFKHDDIELWFEYAHFLYETENADKARNLMKRALDSQPKKHHVSIMSRFAQLEYKNGDAEKGKTIFEKVLSTYPKKLDVWHVYVDLSLKYDGISEARRIFERFVQNSEVPLQKKNSMIKKWIEMEKTHGDADTLAQAKKIVGDLMGKDESESDEE